MKTSMRWYSWLPWNSSLYRSAAMQLGLGAPGNHGLGSITTPWVRFVGSVSVVGRVTLHQKKRDVGSGTCLSGLSSLLWIHGRHCRCGILQLGLRLRYCQEWRGSCFDGSDEARDGHEERHSRRHGWYHWNLRTHRWSHHHPEL